MASTLLTLLTLSLILSPASASTTPSQTPAPELAKRACAADNCLRALRRNAPSAIPFCASYTTAPATATTATPTATIPAWAANCQDNPTRVSSACGCLATAPLTLVYGPTDNTNYTIWSQAENIRSRPETWEESLTQCMGLCYGSGASCQAFSLAIMPGYQGAAGTGLTLCYFYSTLFQVDKVQVATNWTRNVVYERV
ncbi:hypothetical protein B5807_11552 [Epicoccum nigrum]|uniref:Apple domain-containing protein n=1 Tax=Epicoccum nigrum TaxID=105696 RepID=A0A1Y2LJJ3_EPING|nr:hypothetical protein B5807_11552 [Epicoccum nigrum]